MIRLIRILVILLIASGIAISTFFYITTQATYNQEEVTEEQAEEVQPIPAIDVLVVQQDGDEKRVLNCKTTNCDQNPLPKNAARDSVTDGQYWYYYVNKEQDRSNDTVRTLVRADTQTNQVQTLIEQTPLIFPRNLIMSPDGKKVAFWLDNIDNKKEDLTELWIYDAEAGGTRLLAENLTRSDILTNPRWNKASSHLWFIADSGIDDEEKIELLVVNTQPPGIAARFQDLDWNQLKDIAERGSIDISFTGRSVAYVEKTFFDRSRLVVKHEGVEAQTTNPKGDIPYIHWLEDSSLIYAIQDSEGFSFWRSQGTVHSFVARRPGKILSALGDIRGEYLAFSAQDNRRNPALYILNLESGQVQEQGNIPAFGNALHIVHVAQTEFDTPSVAGTNTNQLDDAELTAFVDNNLTEITGDKNPIPIRLITTEKPNVIYVDIRNSQDKEERILLTVKDVIHTEWSIRARYEAVAGEWKKILGGGLPDPKAANIYEWETGPQQWILKESLQN